jgi:hypothetical protein
MKEKLINKVILIIIPLTISNYSKQEDKDKMLCASKGMLNSFEN